MFSEFRFSLAFRARFICTQQVPAPKQPINTPEPGFISKAMAVSLSAWVRLCRQTLLSNRTSPIKLQLCMGNESADLDSLCSSLCFAYYRAQTHAHILPLWQVARDDIALRGDAHWLFSTAPALHGLADDMPCIPDDVPALLAVAGPDRPTSVLTDHNAPTFRWPSSSAAAARTLNTDSGNSNSSSSSSTFADTPLPVTAIIDHHVDAGLFPDAAPRVVESAGSCCTLVAHALHADAQWGRPLLLGAAMGTSSSSSSASATSTATSTPVEQTGLAATGGDDAAWMSTAPADDADRAAWAAFLAPAPPVTLLLLAAILVDTANLTAACTTSQDRAAVAFLLPPLRWSQATAERYLSNHYFLFIFLPFGSTCLLPSSSRCVLFLFSFVHLTLDSGSGPVSARPGSTSRI